MGDFAHDLKAFSGGSKKVFGIFDGVDIFEKNFNILRGGCVGQALKGIDGIGVKLFVAEAGNPIAGEQNQAGAFQFREDGQLGADFSEEWVELRGVAQAGIDTAAGVDHQVESMEALAGCGEIAAAPILIFIDELDGMVTGFRSFGYALVERQTGINGPEHYGNWKRRSCWPGRKGFCGKSCGEGGGAGGRKETASGEFCGTYTSAAAVRGHVKAFHEPGIMDSKRLYVVVRVANKNSMGK